MSLPKLESSRNVTSKVTFPQAGKSKSTEQYDCKLFFRLDGTWSNYLTNGLNYLTQRAEILTRLSKNTGNDLSVVAVVPKSLST